MCAFILMSYRKLLQYEIIDRVQFIVERLENEYEEDGKLFWKEKAISIDRYFDHPSTTRLSPSEAARHIRAYLDHCWETVPSLAILVDEPQTDHALMYEFLKQYGHRPMCYDSKGIYKRNVHITRDLMRGAFSMIDSRFINLEESDMYLYIHRYWQELVQQYLNQQKQQQQQQQQQQQLQLQQHASFNPYRPNPNPNPNPNPLSPYLGQAPLSSQGLSMVICKSAKVVAANQCCVFRTQLGPEVKHVPVFDATQSLLVWAKMEDIKRLFHLQLLKIALVAPSFVLLPKPGSSTTTTPTVPTLAQTLHPYYSRPL